LPDTEIPKFYATQAAELDSSQQDAMYSEVAVLGVGGGYVSGSVLKNQNVKTPDYGAGLCPMPVPPTFGACSLNINRT
jgi:hypothetical protein